MKKIMIFHLSFIKYLRPEMTNSNHDATKNSLDDGISEINVCQLKMNLNDNR